MAEKPIRINKFTVKEGDKEMDVIIPLTGDKSYDAYLEEAEREKTAEQLRKQEKPKPTVSGSEVRGAIKEYKNWLRDRQSGKRSKYY